MSLIFLLGDEFICPHCGGKGIKPEAHTKGTTHTCKSCGGTGKQPFYKGGSAVTSDRELIQ